MNDDYDLFDEDDEATAVVNLGDLRRAAERQQTSHFLLVHVQGTELGRVRELTQDELLVGRGQDADVWIGDDGVSRKHARFLRQDTTYLLEDLNSANGTFVQGERITRRILRDGDQIQLGPSAIFRFSITDEDQKALLEQLYSTSVTDSLTGARNREYLDSLLVSEISYATRHELPLSFVLFDLDHFKRVNDTHGHQAGDAVLVEIADAVRQELRAEDALCRYGGEEFAVVLRSIDLEGAHAMGERIRKLVESLSVRHEDLVLKVTTSIGCSAIAELDDPTPSSLIALADKRLYIAKRSGRNRVVSVG